MGKTQMCLLVVYMDTVSGLRDLLGGVRRAVGAGRVTSPALISAAPFQLGKAWEISWFSPLTPR